MRFLLLLPAVFLFAACETDDAVLDEAALSDVAGKADTDEGTVLEFRDDWSETLSGPLTIGSTIRVRYDLDRLPYCRGTNMGNDAFGMTLAYKFEGRDEIQYAPLTTLGPDGVATPVDALVELPNGGPPGIEMWIYVSNRWGCIEYDSNYSLNYWFEAE